MNHHGLAKELQDAIMNPTFEYERLRLTCGFWSRDSVEMRYAGLEESNELLASEQWLCGVLPHVLAHLEKRLPPLVIAADAQYLGFNKKLLLEYPVTA